MEYILANKLTIYLIGIPIFWLLLPLFEGDGKDPEDYSSEENFGCFVATMLWPIALTFGLLWFTLTQPRRFVYNLVHTWPKEWFKKYKANKKLEKEMAFLSKD